MEKLVKLLLLFISISLLSNCEKDNNEDKNYMTISELINFCDLDNAECNQPLKHEGENVKIKAYIQPLNIFSDNERFAIFDSASMSSMRTDVSVLDDSDKIFNKINENISNIESIDFVFVKIDGIIKGVDLPINAACLKGVIITINNENQIKFE